MRDTACREPADYLSSVSGGGYVAASLAGLCAEELPYTTLKRFGCDFEHCPFASPGAFVGQERPKTLDEVRTSARMLPVHGSESPALWHVRKYANLLGSQIGLFDLATWLSIGRYLVSTALMLLFFLLLPSGTPGDQLGVLRPGQIRTGGCRPLTRPARVPRG